MATNFIPMDETKRTTTRIRQAVGVTRESINQLNDLEGLLLQMVDASDYTEISTETGCAAGDAQTLYNLVNNAKTAINSADLAALVDRLG